MVAPVVVVVVVAARLTGLLSVLLSALVAALLVALLVGLFVLMEEHHHQLVFDYQRKDWLNRKIYLVFALVAGLL